MHRRAMALPLYMQAESVCACNTEVAAKVGGTWLPKKNIKEGVCGCRCPR